MKKSDLQISNCPSLTIVVAFENEELRRIALKSLRRHNTIFDPYQNQTAPLKKLLDIQTYIIFMDYATYQSIADTIIERYQNCDLKTTAPMLIYGLDVSLYKHPLIFDALGLGTDECERFYTRTRRRAKRAALCY